MNTRDSDQTDYTKIPSTDGTGTKMPALISAEVEEVAAWFCSLDHEEQAQFFIEVSKIAETWQGQASNQWWWIGREISLRVEMSKENKSAADMIACILGGIEPS